jgi:hypothetical protein
MKEEQGATGPSAPVVVADRASRRAFFFRRMSGRRTDPVALRELWGVAPPGAWDEVDVLQGIPYAVIGGVATRAYMPERTTADLDLLIEPENLEAAIGQLQAKGYEALPRPIEFFDTRLALHGRRLIGASHIDLLTSNQGWVSAAVSDTRSDRIGLPVVDLSYLVLLKMDASRGIDQGDLTRMLGFASEADLNRVRAVVARLLPADSEDLEQYIAIGRFEVGADPAPE